MNEENVIWAEVEAKYGLQIVRAVRDIVSMRVGPLPDDAEGDPEAIREHWDYYRQEAEDMARGISICLDSGSTVSRGRAEKPLPEKRHRKSLDRGYAFVDFIVRLQCLRRQAGRRVDRINWMAAIEAWNRQDEAEAMSLAVLKAEYYRAIRNAEITAQVRAVRARAARVALANLHYYEQSPIYSHVPKVMEDAVRSARDRLQDMLDTDTLLKGKGGKNGDD